MDLEQALKSIVAQEMSTDGTVKDHESRIRVLEAGMNKLLGMGIILLIAVPTINGLVVAFLTKKAG